MGKDYSPDLYKKSYDNEYVKQYTTIASQKLFDEERKAYDRVSKKLDDTPYSKSEKSIFDGLEQTITSTVDSAGPKKNNSQKTVRNNISKPFESESAETRPLKSEQKHKISTSSLPQDSVQTNTVSKPISVKPSVKKEEPKTDGTRQNRIPSPPPYIPKNKNIKTKDKKPNGYSYIDLNAFEAPILPLSDGSYKNIYTHEIVSESEARELLDYAGYTAEKLFPPIIVILCLILFWSLKIIGPIILIIIGVRNWIKNKTIFKKKIEGITLRFPMPATDKEISKYKSTGVIYIIVAVLAAILHIAF